MIGLLRLFSVLFLRSRASLAAENLALRHQLGVLQRSARRPRLRQRDRVFWVWLSRLWSGWRSSPVIVQLETVVRWHWQGFKLYWRWKSRPRKPGRPQVDAEIRELIRQMSLENPLWGSPRIRDELALLGINPCRPASEAPSRSAPAPHLVPTVVMCCPAVGQVCCRFAACEPAASSVPVALSGIASGAGGLLRSADSTVQNRPGGADVTRRASPSILLVIDTRGGREAGSGSSVSCRLSGFPGRSRAVFQFSADFRGWNPSSRW
jgi:hypothetical protein